MIIEEGKVYTFKLNSGEELISTVKSHSPAFITLESPCSTAPTQQGIQLVPAMFTTEFNSEVDLYRNSVAMISTPREEVANAYRESVTGIKVPDKQILMA